MTTLASECERVDIMNLASLPGTDRDAEFLADKSRRIDSVKTAENREEAASAFSYIQTGLNFLWEHKGKIATIAAVTAGILAGYYFADYLPKLFSGNGFGKLFGSDSAVDTVSQATQAAQSVGSTTTPMVSPHGFGQTTDVLLVGDVKFDPTPIEVNGQRYSIDGFIQNISTWVKDPQSGDSLRLIPGEHCRRSLEVPIQEALKERLIPHTVNGEFSEMFSGTTHFDPFKNLDQSRYWQKAPPILQQ